LERLTLVERRVVFAGEIVVRFHFELRGRVAHVGQALPAFLRIVGGVREISREGDEVRRARKRVHVGDRLVERHLGIRIHRRAREAPVQIGHLEEHEVLRVALGRSVAHAPQPRAEDDAGDSRGGQARELDELAPVQVFRHAPCPSDSRYTGPRAPDWLRPPSVSTLAPLFAAAFATRTSWPTFLVGLAASIGAGISMAFAEALSDNGSLTGRGSPVLRGAICGAMTALGGLGHALPFLIGDFRTATALAIGVVPVELAVIAWIR